ncbi:ferritin heavy chain-like [Rattus rattus]|uniref:ferritin heavy chain-like n=1 Tax=Rattus rattus TaxID=10117 RepID=UPI0013F33D98|nr:ferritin heavy chain-like [Rattus rattus]
MGFVRGPRRHQRQRCPPHFQRFRAASALEFIPPPIVSPSDVRQNFHTDCESAINRHVRLQLSASYVYLSMCFYFDREDVALENFSRYFLNKSHECTRNAEIFLALQNQRGGRVSLRTIYKPDRDNWIGGLPAMERAFQLELHLNQSFVAMYQLAARKKDGHLCSFLQTHFLRRQVEVLKKMSSFLISMRQMGSPEVGMAEYLFGKLSLDDNPKEK